MRSSAKFVERKGSALRTELCPLILWAVPALAAQRSACPVELAGLGVSIAVQTMTCSIEQQSAPELTSDEKMVLVKLHFPYLVPCKH
jgi:hypothetical protein